MFFPSFSFAHCNRARPAAIAKIRHSGGCEIISHLQSIIHGGGSHCVQSVSLFQPSLRVADSSSTNTVSFSSARTTKRFPSSRCASAIQIVRPLESIAETQPQLQPASLKLSAMIGVILRRSVTKEIEQFTNGRFLFLCC